MKRPFFLAVAALLLPLFAAAVFGAQQDSDDARARRQQRSAEIRRAREIGTLGAVPTPQDNPSTPQKVALGKRLFFDPLLSGSNTMSCATCHDPAKGFADGKRFSKGDGLDAKELGRNTPSIVNVAYNLTQFWDGRAGTLEEQALKPVESPIEMNQDVDKLLGELRTAGYETVFAAAFPGEGLNKTTLARALAAYERSLVLNDTRFDRWMRGEKDALSYEAVRGLLIFNSTKGRCTACHSGPNFTNSAHTFGAGFVRIGVKPLPGDPEDAGRAAIITAQGGKPAKSLVGAFKVPPLRGVADTAPYMHNGSLKSLEEVVEFYNRGGDEKILGPLNLNADEKRWLVAFLREGLSR